MSTQSSKKIFPLSYKTAAVSGTVYDPVLGTGNSASYSFIGFQLYQPLQLYATTELKMHFRCTFDPSVSSLLQVVQKISVGGVNVPETIYTNYIPTSGIIDFTIDLASLITPTGDNTIYLFFPAALSPSSSVWSGHYNQIQVQMWKVDMLYQVVGIR